MRLRAGLVSAVIAIASVCALSTPAQASSWVYIGVYTTKFKCVDAGQQYVREGFHEYDCSGSASYWPLWVR